MKLMLTAITLVALVSTSTFAQHTSQPLNAVNGRGYAPVYNFNYDDPRFDHCLDWWNSELDLSRRQQREIRQIREHFHQQTESMNPNDASQRVLLRQARQREFADMMAVLHPDQRNAVVAHMRSYERIVGQNRITGHGRTHRIER